MRVRLYEGEAPPSLRPLLIALGVTIVSVEDEAEADVALWDFSDDPELASREMRERLAQRRPEPAIAVLPGEQVGVEMAALHGGCEGVMHLPISPDGLRGTFAAIGLEPPEGEGPVLVLPRVDDLPEGCGIQTWLEGPGRLLLESSDRDSAARVLRRLSVDLVLMDGRRGGVPERLQDLASVGAQLAVVVVDSEASELAVRDYLKAGASDYLDLDEEGGRVERRIADVLRERADRLRGEELARTISTKQRELQRMNETLMTMNKAITDANVRLERQGHKKDEMLGVAAHELKSPLAAIAGALDILCEDTTRFDEDDRELMELVQRNVIRMVKLVDDTLDLVRMEAGRIKLRPSRMPIEPLIEHAVNTVALRARGKRIRFDVGIDAEGSSLMLDEGRISQMLINLLDNAVKFSPRESIVRVQVKRGGGRLHLVVADAGPGVPDAERERVFERFNHKARGDDMHSAGSGLGLTITRALAQLHGGEVTLGESPSGGAQFTISLPLK